MKKYQIWIDETDDGEEITLMLKSQSKVAAGVSDNAKLFAEYEAETYDQAAQKKHELLG